MRPHRGACADSPENRGRDCRVVRRLLPGVHNCAMLPAMPRWPVAGAPAVQEIRCAPEVGKRMILLCVALALQQPSDSLTLSEALERARRQRGIVVSSAAGVAGARAAVRVAG